MQWQFLALVFLSASRQTSALPSANFDAIKGMVSANVGEQIFQISDVEVNPQTEYVSLQIQDTKSNVGRAVCAGNWNSTLSGKTCSMSTFMFKFSQQLPANWTVVISHTVKKGNKVVIRTGGETFPCSVADGSGQVAFQAPGCLQVGPNCKRTLYAPESDGPDTWQGDTATS